MSYPSACQEHHCMNKTHQTPDCRAGTDASLRYAVLVCGEKAWYATVPRWPTLLVAVVTLHHGSFALSCCDRASQSQF